MDDLLERARAIDDADPTAPFRDRFVIPDPDLVYLDGNSLGRPTRAAAGAATAVLDTWATDLIGGWDRWIDRSLAVGDRLAPVLGAGQGQVVVGESTTVRLHQALHAAIAARPGRSVVVAVADDFPTDRYVVEGVATSTHRRIRWVDDHDTDALVAAIDDDVVAVVASVASYATAALVDVETVTDEAHRRGALVVWDCSHAAGAVPLDLDAHDVDMAVGCTYKYLHGGPGSPAFVYVARDRQRELRQPVQGWFGQRDQFAMGPHYDPVAGIGQWQAGTPAMVSLEVAATGIDVVADAGIAAVRAKSLALGALLLDGFDHLLAPLGFTVAGPRHPSARGGHLALRHVDASRIVRAGRLAGVVTDHRAPDLVRLGPGPLAATATEVAIGLTRLAEIVSSGEYRTLGPEPGRVT